MTAHDECQHLADMAKAFAKQMPPQKLTLIQAQERTETMNHSPHQPAAFPLHKHGAFLDIDCAADILSMGADAMKGIGAMLMPDLNSHDGNMLARRSDAAAVFNFFGEILKEAATTVQEATETLEQAAKAEE